MHWRCTKWPASDRLRNRELAPSCTSGPAECPNWCMRASRYRVQRVWFAASAHDRSINRSTSSILLKLAATGVHWRCTKWPASDRLRSRELAPGCTAGMQSAQIGACARRDIGCSACGLRLLHTTRSIDRAMFSILLELAATRVHWRCTKWPESDRLRSRELAPGCTAGIQSSQIGACARRDIDCSACGLRLLRTTRSIGTAMSSILLKLAAT